MPEATLTLDADPELRRHAVDGSRTVVATAWVTAVELRRPDGSTVRARPQMVNMLSRDVAVDAGLDVDEQGVAVRVWAAVEDEAEETQELPLQ